MAHAAHLWTEKKKHTRKLTDEQKLEAEHVQTCEPDCVQLNSRQSGDESSDCVSWSPLTRTCKQPLCSYVCIKVTCDHELI